MSVIALCGPLAASGARADGVWLPAAGAVNQQSVLRLDIAEDGSVYAAGSGRVFRFVDRRWQVVGHYAPTLHWDGDSGVEADGPFPAKFLRDVADDAAVALDNAASDGLGTAGSTEDIVNDFLEQYTAEADARPDSPYAVHDLAGAKDGAWIATGGGVFYAHGAGVDGPMSGIDGVPTSVEVSGESAVVGTAEGLFTVVRGQAAIRMWTGPVDAVVIGDGAVHFLMDGALRVWQPGVRAVAIETPTGRPHLLAGDGRQLWVSTELATYRRIDGEWRLCDALPEPPHGLTAHDGRLMALTEDAVYLADPDCERFERMPAPWIGALRFTDATMVEDRVWASSTDGVYRRTVATTSAALMDRMVQFRRELERMPGVDAVTDAALAFNLLKPGSLNYGYRPVLADLLPKVRVLVSRDYVRREVIQTLVDRNGKLEVEPPLNEWTVLAEWIIDLDTIYQYLGLDRRDLWAAEWLILHQRRQREAAEGSGGTAKFEDFEDFEDIEDYSDDETLLEDEVDEAGFTLGDNGNGDGDELSTAAITAESGSDGTLDDASDDADVVAAAVLAAERLVAQRARAGLVKSVGRLYRLRQTLLYRLWLEGDRALPDTVGIVLEMDEVDAQLDAFTGGEYSRRFR